jgi:hypothetical protein
MVGIEKYDTELMNAFILETLLCITELGGSVQAEDPNLASPHPL